MHYIGCKSMISKIKRSISYLLAVMVFFVLICALMPATVLADEGDTGTTDGWKWTEQTDGTLSITGHTNPTGSLILPASLAVDPGETVYRYVYRIEDNAFDGKVQMTGITLPYSLRSIGNGAFSRCSELESVNMSNCSNLESIGDNAFMGNTALGPWGSSLETVIIPDSVTSVGEGVFSYCCSLTSVTLSSNLSNIGDSMFYSCSSLTSVTIPGSVTSIGEAAFEASRLTGIVIPDSVTSIGDASFKSCTSLESVTLPTNAGFTGIPDYAFQDCNALTGIMIPASVASIGRNALEGCSALNAINVHTGNTHFSSLKGVLFDAGKTRLICHPVGCSGSFDIPGTVISIDDYAFAGSDCLIGVSIPEGVTSIGDYAFYNCRNTALTEIIIPQSVTSIGAGAFDGCRSLEEITIPEGITTIGNHTFNNCSNLSKITLPESITSIGSCAFLACENLTEITIPEGVGSIGNNAFSFCFGLRKVDILNSSMSFGSDVFKFTAISSDGIYGFNGSTAQTYAQAQSPSIPFHYLYTVSFSTGGGSWVSKIIAVAGDKIMAPAVPTNSGYNFGGWFKDEACTIAWDFDNDTVTGNITLHARWTQTIVNIAAIPGVTAPARGAVPATTITETAQYIGSVTWSPADNPFAAGTVYTATVTLTPKDGYTLNGVGENFFTVAGATSVSNAANSGVITAGFPATEAAPVPTYALTITAETGGSITRGSSGNYAAGTVIDITATASANYSFNKWTSTGGGTFGNANSNSTTFTMPAGVATIKASLTYNGGGGSDRDGGSGSSGGSTPPAPVKHTSTYTAVVTGTDTAGNILEITLPVTVNTNTGSAAIDIGSGQGNIVTGGGNAAITIPSIPGVTDYTLDIPVAYLSMSGGEGALTFNTNTGSFTLPADMLAGIAGVEGKKVGITIGQGDKSGLPEAAKAAIGDRPLIQLEVTVDGKQTDWNNPNAPVTVSIPYTPTAAELENPESIIIWYIDGSGNAVSVPNGHYDPATGTVTFTTTHFSYYAVGYNKVSFKDVAADAWYSKAVGFIAARNITAGANNGNFYSEAKLTRGEFLVMLMRAYDMEPDTNPKDNFTAAAAPIIQATWLLQRDWV